VRLGRDEQDIVERQALPGELVLERDELLDPSDVDVRQLKINVSNEPGRRWRTGREGGKLLGDGSATGHR
jgi:hypothetical protein